MLKTISNKVSFSQILGIYFGAKKIELEIINSSNEFGKQETQCTLHVTMQGVEEKEAQIDFLDKEQLLSFCNAVGFSGEQVGESDIEFYKIGK